VSGKRAWRDSSEADDASPFAKLAALREALPAGPPERAEPDARPEPPAAQKKGPAKAVVRIERKGRGGKDVTVVEQLGLGQAELAAWLKALKSQLGCGGAVEGDNLILQGDLRKRIRAPLEARGVRKIVGE
jgi:translation initiation factor 1